MMVKVANHVKMHPLPWEHQTHELSEGYSTIIYDANGVRPTLDHLREDEAALIVTAVNAFEPMKESIVNLMRLVESHTGADDAVANAAIEQAAEALRLAEGEKE